VCCSVLQCVAVCYSVSQCVAVCCSVFEGTAVSDKSSSLQVCFNSGNGVLQCCSVMQCVTVCFIVLQCVAVYCSVLQCVAVFWRDLQCSTVAVASRYVWHDSLICIAWIIHTCLCCGYCATWQSSLDWVEIHLGAHPASSFRELFVYCLFWLSPFICILFLMGTAALYRVCSTGLR